MNNHNQSFDEEPSDRSLNNRSQSIIVLSSPEQKNEPKRVTTESIGKGKITFVWKTKFNKKDEPKSENRKMEKNKELDLFGLDSLIDSVIKKPINAIQSNEVLSFANKLEQANIETIDSSNKKLALSNDFVYLVTEENQILEATFSLLINSEQDLSSGFDSKLRSFLVDNDRKIYLSSLNKFHGDQIFDYLTELDARVVQFVKFDGVDRIYDDLVGRSENFVQVKLNEKYSQYQPDQFYLCALDNYENHHEG